MLEEKQTTEKKKSARKPNIHITINLPKEPANLDIPTIQIESALDFDKPSGCKEIATSRMSKRESSPKKVGFDINV